MATTAQRYVGDYGTTIKILLSGSTDLTGGTAKIRAKPPSGAAVEWSATLDVPSRAVSYTLAQGDLTVDGAWKLQAVITKTSPSLSIASDPVDFFVGARL